VDALQSVTSNILFVIRARNQSFWAPTQLLKKELCVNL